jgi:hypothetical protein
LTTVQVADGKRAELLADVADMVARCLPDCGVATIEAESTGNAVAQMLCCVLVRLHRALGRIPAFGR